MKSALWLWVVVLVGVNVHGGVVRYGGGGGLPARSVVGSVVIVERDNGGPSSNTDSVFRATWTVSGTASAISRTIHGYIVDTGTETGVGHPIAIFGETYMPVTMQRFAGALEGYNRSVSQYPGAHVNGAIGHSIWDSAASTGTSANIIGGHMLAEVFNGDGTTPRSTGTVISLMLDANVGGATKYGIYQAGPNDTNLFLGPVYASSGVIVTGYRSIAQLVTVADNGGGTPATATVTPTSDYVVITCNDANGCTMSMSETGAVDGRVVELRGASANLATFADSSGVLELSGGASAALGAYDMLQLRYVVNAWAEMGRSDN